MNELKTVKELEKLIAESTKLLFIKVGANWCNPCKLLERNLNEIISFYPDIDFYMVDADTCEDDLTGRLSVYNLPTTIIYKDSEEIFRYSGVLNKNQLNEILNKYKG